ncbi:Protein of unknown function [Salegentibacter holothuriorum]|uniref:DUF2480 family protein n=1 Tax=Salegentibacter holothuriorum TaxID=241145 RepID=A0A1T5C1M8_9FLAO|nr:DUF2480 family protein [Salegentibacter holothuriorum]SKB53315.1 Protein of unknown function [Salegentibacter holothuriorum]
MAEEIVNRIANSKLITFNLEDYYPEGERVLFDVKDWLLEGFVLRESEFREQAKNHDWSQYEDKFIALTCSSDAIIPAWAFMLLATYLQPHAKKVITGDLETLETVLYTEAILKMDVSDLQDKPVIVKGCAHKPVPKNAYLLLIEKLQPIVKSLMYGEACSSVPLYKKSKK